MIERLLPSHLDVSMYYYDITSRRWLSVRDGTRRNGRRQGSPASIATARPSVLPTCSSERSTPSIRSPRPSGHTRTRPSPTGPPRARPVGRRRPRGAPGPAASQIKRLARGPRSPRRSRRSGTHAVKSVAVGDFPRPRGNAGRRTTPNRTDDDGGTANCRLDPRDEELGRLERSARSGDRWRDVAIQLMNCVGRRRGHVSGVRPPPSERYGRPWVRQPRESAPAPRGREWPPCRPPSEAVVPAR
jgi:hypothetical protein